MKHELSSLFPSDTDADDAAIWDAVLAPERKPTLASAIAAPDATPLAEPATSPAPGTPSSIPPFASEPSGYLSVAPGGLSPVQASSVLPPSGATPSAEPAVEPSVPPSAGPAPSSGAPSSGKERRISVRGNELRRTPGSGYEPRTPGSGNEPRTPVPRGVFSPGEQFGVYRIGPCIGEGGMARIYQAEHAGLRRQVALKVLLDATTRAPEGRERFLREAQIAAAIKHPNVVNIFDVGVHEDTAFLVMELLTGTDLEQLIQTRGALDEATIVDIMIPVLAGLTAVHDAGVVHRDLKPGNIFLAQGRYEEVDPKLLDFGICKAPGVEQLRLTANGMLIGTPFYMSPEGLRGDEMTPSSDQYSLGVVMYECATGVNPFGATTFAEIFKLIGAGQFPPPSSTRPQISKRLERIITRAMSLDPTHRFKDLREMGRELLLLAGQRTRITWALSFGELERPKGAGSPVWSGASRAPLPASTPEDRKRRTQRRALLVVPWLLLAAALVIWWSRTPTEPRFVASKPARQPVATAGAALQPAGTNQQVPAGLAAADQNPPGDATVDSPASARPIRKVWGGRRRGVNGAAPEKPEDTSPEWDLPTAPPSVVKAGPSRAQSGANGAPIFD